MSIGTYSELQTAIANWRARGDLSSKLADFITLAEAKINRRLRTVNQETAIASTAIASDYTAARPADCLEVKALWCVTDPERSILPATLGKVIEFQADGAIPTLVAWSGSDFVFNGNGSNYQGIYYAKVPALSGSATTNWLLTASPDVYLMAGIEQACIYLRDSEGAMLYGGKADALIEELNSVSGAARVGGGKLVSKWR